MNGGFNHQLDFWVGYQLQPVVGHLRCKLQCYTGEAEDMQAVEFMGVDHGLSKT